MRKKVHDSVLDIIGNTPMVKLSKITGMNDANVYGKLESFNPAGSVKDRICLSMIEDAERRGVLKIGSTIVEPTSGNTGIGLAMVAAVKGYKLILTMPETMSIERRNILSAYGAELVLTPGAEGMPGAIRKAESIIRDNPDYFMPQQFNNPTNPEIHRRTTAIEIINDTEGEIDAFVAGVGTGGTITGVGEILKEKLKNVQIVAVEPEKSPVISGGKPGPHKIQGIGAGFIPEVLNVSIIDRVIKVRDEDAIQTVRDLAKKEGILAGISAGANVFAALIVARDLGKGKKVVVILPDTGERYLSMVDFSN